MALAAVLVLLTVGQDFLYSCFQTSAFYFSESFMFSSFWWIFIPLLYAQYKWAVSKTEKKKAFILFMIALPVLLHLLAFPALVFLISKIFYYHTFEFQQTLQYGLSEYLCQLLVIYSLPFLSYLYFKRKSLSASSTENAAAPKPAFKPAMETAILVSEGNRRVSITLAGIRYISACPPYIHIHHNDRKYLHRATLKWLLEKPGADQFLRIHKSTIVNINAVQSYTSRLNGDYDLTLTDGTCLRLSRNYAPAFKARFQGGHRLAAK